MEHGEEGLPMGHGEEGLPTGHGEEDLPMGHGEECLPMGSCHTPVTHSVTLRTLQGPQEKEGTQGNHGYKQSNRDSYSYH